VLIGSSNLHLSAMQKRQRSMIRPRIDTIVSPVVLSVMDTNDMNMIFQQNAPSVPETFVGLVAKQWTVAQIVRKDVPFVHPLHVIDVARVYLLPLLLRVAIVLKTIHHIANGIRVSRIKNKYTFVNPKFHIAKRRRPLPPHLHPIPRTILLRIFIC
jgi:hypothetical protein